MKGELFLHRSIRIIFYIACFLIGLLFAINNSNNSPSSRSSLISTPQTTIVAIPTAPPEGWLRFQGKSVAMYLPDSFIGGNTKDLSEVILTVAENELPEAVSLLQNALQNPEQFLFIALDKNNAVKFLTNVNVSKSRFLDKPYPLQDVLNEAVKQLPKQLEGIEILESSIVKINTIEVIRFVQIMHLRTYSAKALSYIHIDENNDAWIVTYTTSPDEFDDRLPVFEKSYQSFELLPP